MVTQASGDVRFLMLRLEPFQGVILPARRNTCPLDRRVPGHLPAPSDEYEHFRIVS